MSKNIFLNKLPRKGNGKQINWRKSVGYFIEGIYNNLKFKIKIIDYYRINNTSYLDINYNNKKFLIPTQYLINCNLGNILGLINYNYIYKIGDMITNIRSGKLKILEQIRIEHGKSYERGYKYRCLICNNEDIISEHDLNNYIGCNVCCNPPKKVLVGYNDMWTTNPELAKLLADPNDGYKYTQCSGQKVDWKCPNCGNIINKKISNIKNRGISCPKCSDGVSYPEKFMYNILKELNIEFIYQLSSKNFKWCNEYRYDFYISKYNIIIEVHGIGHYQEGFSSCNGRKLKEEKENDRLKKELALQNGIKEDNYIVIDCRYSEMNWIKTHTMSSKLNDIFNLSNINWLNCHKYACSSLVKKACNLWNSGIHSTVRIGEIMKLKRQTIRKYLKQGVLLKWCNYNPKEEKIKSGKINSQKNNKKIICLNEEKIFNSIRKAAKYYNLLSDKHIPSCCKGERNYCGINLKTGAYLQWQYYNEYLINPKKLLTNEEIDKLNSHEKKVICLNNNKIFNSIKEAQEYYNINGISNCCKGKFKSCGKNPITKEPLHWMYYEDYLKENNI